MPSPDLQAFPKPKYLCRGVAAALLMIASGASVHASGPKIELYEMGLESVSAHQVKVTMAANSEGVDVGSYFIRLDKKPEEGQVHGFFREGGKFHYLEAQLSGKSTSFLVDNGTKDEQPNEGVFATTIDTTSWPDGRYEFRAGAHNRPAKGSYISDHKVFQIVIRDGQAIPSLIDKPYIKITNFEINKISKHRINLSTSAEGYGVEIESFTIRVDSRPKGSLLPGFFQSQYYEYLMQPHEGKPSGFLIDNGPLDEDKRVGTFSYTLDTTSWPKGQYSIVAGASNRPSSGRYIGALTDYFNLSVGSDAEGGAISNIPGAKHGVIYKKDGVYACFPSLAVLPDGRLMVSMGTRTNRSHVDPEGGMAYMVSSDRGETWTPSHERMLRREWKTSDGRYVTVDTEGWVFANASRLQELKEQNRILEPNGEVRPGVIAYLGGVRARVSNDGGNNWESQPIPVHEDYLGFIGYNKAANELVTKKGARLYFPYGKRHRPDREGGQGLDEVFVVRSDDDGRTWECRPMFPDGVAQPELSLNETAVVETDDGRLVALIRNALDEPGDDTFLWQTESTDEGLTWSPPHQTKIWGYPASLRTLPDGTLLCAYGYRRPPMGIRASISKDGGRTWDVKNEMILRQDGLGHGGDLGYPMLHIFEDGEILAVYYLTTDGKNTHIAYTKFRVPSTIK